MIWHGIGKPRQGYEFDMVRFSRAQFKYGLRSAKQQEGTLRRESLAKKLALSQPNKFWQDIGLRVMNGNHKSVLEVYPERMILLMYGENIFINYSIVYRMMM